MKQAELETPVLEACRKHGVDTLFYRQRKQYGGISTKGLMDMRLLEEEYLRLKKRLLI
ncbi:hypothetical protein [Citrobacter freundii]|uniref:hypothetical protein n=1 Tax=Citrobacter freundii TaxID=546 RepID=UPI0039903EAC